MRIIARATSRNYWIKNPDSEEHLKSWFKVTGNADWKNPQEVKKCYRNASILKDGRVVFNIAGNKFRLVVWVNYPHRVVYIRFIGTHEECDKTDVQTI